MASDSGDVSIWSCVARSEADCRERTTVKCREKEEEDKDLQAGWLVGSSP